MNVTSALSFPTKLLGRLYVNIASYQCNGAMAIELSNEFHEDYGALSVNLEEFAHELGPNEFFAKTWSENEETAPYALASGLFQDTGRRVE